MTKTMDYRALCVLVAAGVLSACGGSSNRTEPKDATTGSGGSVTLRDAAPTGSGGAPGSGGLSGTDGGLGGGGTGGGTGVTCGLPGAPCCDGNGCNDGGCCVTGICMGAGSICVGLGGGLCSAGACGACGGPGLPCCGASAATGVCTSAGTTCNGGTCSKCGELGSPCCANAAGRPTSCKDPKLVCSNSVCIACGVPGGPCCPGSKCDGQGCCYGGTCVGEAGPCGASSGVCQAGRCTGCGAATQACCVGQCYDGMLCKSSACTPCGGTGQPCCQSGSSVTCQAGLACVGDTVDSICARCGTLGDMCCAGNTCREGCCSGGRCLAGGTCTQDAGTPVDATAPDASQTGRDASIGGAGGAGGAGGTGGGGGTGGTGGSGTIPTWSIPVGCGDGILTAPERCDDGNNQPFDGCSSDCRNEPLCKGPGPCTSRCGDGIVLGEECDDGNIVSGDGCSATCTVEAGFACEQPPLGPSIFVPAVYRDFRYLSPADFEPTVMGQEKASPGMVVAELDADGKPVFTGISGGGIRVTSKESFATWYRNVPGTNSTTYSTMVLWDDGRGGFVNRYKPNGGLWDITETALWCGDVGSEEKDANGAPIPCTNQYAASTSCTELAAKGYQRLSCYVEGGTYRAKYLVAQADGNPLFFPVDQSTFTPSTERSAATIPPPYDRTNAWPYELDDAGNKVLHNFSFTTELRTWFKYDANRTYRLAIAGDDDLWIFINKQLALDLGGIHTPVEGTVTVDATLAAKLGLVSGAVYEVAIFQAERQTTASSFKITVDGFNTNSSQCLRI